MKHVKVTDDIDRLGSGVGRLYVVRVSANAERRTQTNHAANQALLVGGPSLPPSPKKGRKDARSKNNKKKHDLHKICTRFKILKEETHIETVIRICSDL